MFLFEVLVFCCFTNGTSNNLFFSLLYGSLFLDIPHVTNESQKLCSSNRAGTNCPTENFIFTFGFFLNL